MSLRKLLLAGATGAALALGAGVAAHADQLPVAGDECDPDRDPVELVDGTVLECQKNPDNARERVWVVTFEPDPEPSEEPTDEPSEAPDPEPTKDPDPAPADPDPEPSQDPEDGAPETETVPCADLPGVECSEIAPGDLVEIDGVWYLCLEIDEDGKPVFAETDGPDDGGEPDDGKDGKDGKDDSSADPGDAKPAADDRSESPSTLPVTGGALMGLVATAVAASGLGGTALYLSRKRKADDGGGVDE